MIVGKYAIVPWILREYQGPAPISVPETFEQWKNPSCLGFIGDYTTHLYGDYFSKPL